MGASYLVRAVVVEKRSVREVAQTHGVSKTWLYELVSRYRAGAMPPWPQRAADP
jgi:transposase